MATECKRDCLKYKANMKNTIKRYRKGVKRCGSCNIFIQFNGIRCPCCNDRLRQKPKNNKKKYKE